MLSPGVLINLIQSSAYSFGIMNKINYQIVFNVSFKGTVWKFYILKGITVKVLFKKLKVYFAQRIDDKYWNTY